jgi:hypothetical protein
MGYFEDDEEDERVEELDEQLEGEEEDFDDEEEDETIRELEIDDRGRPVGQRRSYYEGDLE